MSSAFLHSSTRSIYLNSPLLSISSLFVVVVLHFLAVYTTHTKVYINNNISSFKWWWTWESISLPMFIRLSKKLIDVYVFRLYIYTWWVDSQWDNIQSNGCECKLEDIIIAIVLKCRFWSFGVSCQLGQVRMYIKGGGDIHHPECNI